MITSAVDIPPNPNPTLTLTLTLIMTLTLTLTMTLPSPSPNPNPNPNHHPYVLRMAVLMNGSNTNKHTRTLLRHACALGAASRA